MTAGKVQPLLDETEELIRIFVASIRTSKSRQTKKEASQ
jgi:hypothetical protein